MTGRSWDVQGEADGALQQAIEHFGPRVLSNPRVLDNLLSDLLPDEPAEARLLVLAAEHDLAGSLSQLCQTVGTDEAIRLASSRFAECYPIDGHAAVWATVTVAGALGRPTTTSTELLLSGPAAPPAPAAPPTTTPQTGLFDRPTTEARPTAPAPTASLRPPGPPAGAGVAPARPKHRAVAIAGVVIAVAVLAGLGVAGGVALTSHPANVAVTSPPTATTSTTTVPSSSTSASTSTAPSTAPPTTASVVPVAAAATTTDPGPAEQTLGRYFAAVGAANWQGAWATFSPAEQSRASPAQIAQGATGSQDSAIVIETLTANANGSEVANVSFQSTQPPANSPNGSACDDWNLDYTLIPAGSALLIDQVAPVSNPPYSAC